MKGVGRYGGGAKEGGIRRLSAGVHTDIGICTMTPCRSMVIANNEQAVQLSSSRKVQQHAAVTPTALANIYSETLCSWAPSLTTNLLQAPSNNPA